MPTYRKNWLCKVICSSNPFKNLLKNFLRYFKNLFEKFCFKRFLNSALHAYTTHFFSVRGTSSRNENKSVVKVDLFKKEFLKDFEEQSADDFSHKIFVEFRIILFCEIYVCNKVVSKRDDIKIQFAFSSPKKAGSVTSEKRRMAFPLFLRKKLAFLCADDYALKRLDIFGEKFLFSSLLCQWFIK